MKKKPEYREMSLFNDSFFEPQPTLGSATSQEEDIPVPTVDDKKKDVAKRTVDDALRIRAKKQRLKVTFADGTVMCDISGTVTMMRAIEKLGIERVVSLGLEVCHVPLVSREIVPRYAPWTKEICEGWYLMAQSDTAQKYMQMKSIVAQLASDVKVEMGDFETMASDESNGKRKEYRKKSKLCVTFPDGSSICSIDHQKIFLDVVMRIGLDKVKQTNIQVAGKEIVTSYKKYNGQIQLPSQEWLTMPPHDKNKYKILRVLSSMTHTPFEVKIIEAV